VEDLGSILGQLVKDSAALARIQFSIVELLSHVVPVREEFADSLRHTHPALHDHLSIFISEKLVQLQHLTFGHVDMGLAIFNDLVTFSRQEYARVSRTILQQGQVAVH
jgi:hypothetical protein